MNGSRSTRSIKGGATFTAALLALAACASSPIPNEKIAVAKDSVQRAEQSGAQELAPVELSTARDKLQRAEKAAADHDAEPAAMLAEQANVDAQLAEATAQEHRSHKAEAELEASLQALRDQANHPSPTASPPPSPLNPSRLNHPLSKRNRVMSLKSTTGLGLGLVLAACASSPQPNAALETARTQVSAAEADPNVARYAPLDLEAARKDLALAESAAEHHRDAEISQPAYMAAQTARLAQARAAAKADDAKVAQGQQERDRIQLAARQREVNVAVQQRDAASQQAAAASQQAQDLQSELQAMKAKQTNRGIVLTLGDVLFDTGRSELNPGAATKMDQLAQFLTEHPDRRVEIDGFTDSVGSDAYNDELSQRRANSVKAALVTRGVDPTRINTQGYGKAYPVASNTDSGGRQLNRRVEVVIGGGDNAPIVPRG